MEKQLQQFLIDDLNKVEPHINEIIQYVYNSTHDKEIGGYKEDIEKIEMFFSYWKKHAQFEKETELKNQ